MADGTNGLRQLVQVMETGIGTAEGGHVLGPRGKDEQRTSGTGIETAALRLPVRAYRVALHVNQAQPLVQRHVFDALLTLGNAGSDQHVTAVGC